MASSGSSMGIYYYSIIGLEQGELVASQTFQSAGSDAVQPRGRVVKDGHTTTAKKDATFLAVQIKLHFLGKVNAADPPGNA